MLISSQKEMIEAYARIISLERSATAFHPVFVEPTGRLSPRSMIKGTMGKALPALPFFLPTEIARFLPRPVLHKLVYGGYWHDLSVVLCQESSQSTAGLRYSYLLATGVEQNHSWPL